MKDVQFAKNTAFIANDNPISEKMISRKAYELEELLRTL